MRLRAANCKLKNKSISKIIMLYDQYLYYKVKFLWKLIKLL